MTRSSAFKKAGMLLAMAILLTGCAETMAGGTDAGCISYGEARLTMPDLTMVPPHIADWIANLDDRMTGACRS